uniref:F-box domain-containing protein n=1 Tax=Hordeum vulgare subsp. vulgare TaxID=112509 RepID=A0A8I6Y521_HORVV
MMGEMIDLATSTTVDHCHPDPRQLRRGGGGGGISIRIADHQFEPLIILAFRAISEHIGRSSKAFHRERIADGRLHLLSILLCGAIHAKGIAATDRSKMHGILLCGVTSDYVIRDDRNSKDPPIDVLRDLPEGLLWIIFSKLPLDAAVRTSALSRQWRYLWTDCPKLSFDGDALCGDHKNKYRKRVHTLMFLRIVNRVLAQFRGKLVEELVVKIEFNWMLVEHLDNWIRSAVSSRINALVFDLAPKERHHVGRVDRYRFPFELLDKDSICHLQIIHLSFVDLQPPMHFSGFPILRKLDLNLVNVNEKDITHMLSNCCNLEWLSIVRCHLNGELKVSGPLPHLLYLKIASCNFTSVEFHAVNLATFEYRGLAVPIDLSKSLELKCANIWYFGHNLEHTITVLEKVLMNVRHLILNAGCKPSEIPCLMHYPWEFSRMTYLQLRLVYAKEFDSLSLISFLRSAPFIEKLELHFCNTAYVRVVQEPEPIRKLPERLFNNMRSLHITGFEACKGEVEFLLHMVKNAPALEVLNIDHSYQYLLEGFKKDTKLVVDLVHTTTRRHLEGKISPKCTLILL